MSCPVTVRLGVYALGAADAAERLLVESHVATCESCRTELAQLEPLPGLLAQVPAELLRDDHVTTRARPAPAWRAMAGVAVAAAAVVFAAGGIWLAQPGSSQPASTSPRAALTLSAANPVTHVRVTATLTRTSWGTRIRLVVWGLPLNQPCRLIIRSRAGATEVAGTWDAWRAGTVMIPASAGWRPSDISSLRVATTARTLVTLSAVPQGRHVRPAPAPSPARSSRM